MARPTTNGTETSRRPRRGPPAGTATAGPGGNGAARAVRLRRSDTTVPGIRRRRHGGGFVYLSPDGSGLKDEETLRRIDDLKIPPAWDHVWISPWPNGHLQAVGTDAAGRRQYLYHERWRLRRDTQKFRRMQEFARALPRLRREVAAALEQPGLERERAAAPWRAPSRRSRTTWATRRRCAGARTWTPA